MSIHKLCVSDFMSTNVVKFSPQDNVISAVEKLNRHGVHGGPVVNDNDEVVGFISEQDCIAPLLQASYHCELTATVADLMRTEVITVTPELGLVELAQRLSANKPKIYPVVRLGKLIGTISRNEVVQALLEDCKECYLQTA